MITDSNLAVAAITPQTINYVIQRIVSTTRPKKIVLFGSWARNESTPHSDIDLLVITQAGENREQTRLAIEKALRGRRFGIDLLVRTPEDIAHSIEGENPFVVNEILQNGRVLYEC